MAQNDTTGADLTTDELYCLACDKAGHRTTECHSTHGINTPQARELHRLCCAAFAAVPASEPVRDLSKLIELDDHELDAKDPFTRVFLLAEYWQCEARKARKAAAPAPVDMILHCQKCGLQHIDAPDDRTTDWTNPPHKSHLCHGCGHIWRPADVPTNGVSVIATKGSADSPTAAPAPVSGMPDLARLDHIIGMEVSMDVSTGDDDAMHRIYGTVNEVMLAERGAGTNTILATEEARNFTLPAAPAPTEQATDFLMPEAAWNEYATRSGLLDEHGVAPDPAKTQTAYFAYIAAWNRLHAAFSDYIAARPPARNRDADRARFPDPEFNAWLDDPVTENGEFSVWHLIRDVSDAWSGWDNSRSCDTLVRQLVDIIDGQRCTHTNTHRGGAIWTICDDCGSKWADNEPRRPYPDPPALIAARRRLGRL